MCDQEKMACTKSVQAVQNVQLENLNQDVLPQVATASGSLRSSSFVNMFAAKKTVAQGMMDIALITANANQLRYLLEYCQQSRSFFIVFILIIISLFLQVVVGVFLIFKGRYDRRHERLEHAMRMSNFIVFGVFLITIINVFISAFTVTAISIPTVQVVKDHK